MNTTTPSLLPATSRAGASGYSPDAASAIAPDDSSATQSFDELCPEDDRPAKAGVETADTCDARDPAPDATSEPASANETATDETEGDDEEETRRRRAAEVGLTIPSILAAVREILPQAIVAASALAGLAPAEIAATPGEAVPASANPASQPQNDTQTSTLARVLAGVRRGRGNHAEGANREAVTEGKGLGKDTSTSATAGVPTKPGLATPADTASRAGRTEAETPDQATAQPTVARLLTAKGQVEKSAAQGLLHGTREIGGAENKFLSTDDQAVTSRMRMAGTRTAISAGTMSSSNNTTPRTSDNPVLATAAQTANGQGTWTEALSVDWKGWTNGGGERSSSAAQFSQLGEKITHLAVSATPASAGRIATSAAPATAPAAPTVPVEAAEALAPIHSAIERLVLHGRDQLALTVRFEQGGSLSIKLSMQNGEISTQIQTDVSGLEAALKSSWGELVQDWNSRGWKLAHPEFSTSPATYHHREDATAEDRASGRQNGRDTGEAPSFAGRALSPARLKHAGGVALSGLEALRAAARARSGIHTWA